MNFQVGESCFFKNLFKYHEMPWVYPSLIINVIVSKLKLALLVHFLGGGVNMDFVIVVLSLIKTIRKEKENK